MPKSLPNDYPVDPLIQNRWSPLAFSERAVTQDTVRSLFEAARWAPSCFNAQPWRFLVGTKDGDPEAYAKILDCLVPANQVWASTAPLLLIGVANTRFEHNGAENRFALYDLGQAIAYLTLEATSLGLSLHQMGGFDSEKARDAFGVPDTYAFGAAIALGYEGDADVLPDQKYRDRHNDSARLRKPLSSLVFSGAEEEFGAASPLI